MMMMNAPNLGCPLPPAGWYCTREPGHDGPCATWPNRTRIHKLLRQAFELGMATDCYDPEVTQVAEVAFDAFAAAHEGQLDWAIAEAITNSEAIDDMIRVLIDDSTHDNAVCLVRGVIEAYLKGTP